MKRLSWHELQLATDDFSENNVLGQRGFGKVCKGVLGNNIKVAVKRLTALHENRKKSSIAPFTYLVQKKGKKAPTFQKPIPMSAAVVSSTLSVEGFLYTITI